MAATLARVRSTDVVKLFAWENGALAVMARVLNISGVAITQASFGTITCDVYDLTDRSQTGDLTVTVSSAVYDTLQTGDPRWTLDTTGYNFLYMIAGTAFPEGDRTYQVEFTFNPSSGSPFYLVGRVQVGGLFSN